MRWQLQLHENPGLYWVTSSYQHMRDIAFRASFAVNLLLFLTYPRGYVDGPSGDDDENGKLISALSVNAGASGACAHRDGRRASWTWAPGPLQSLCWRAPFVLARLCCRG